MKINISILFVLILFAAGCSQKEEKIPNDILSKEEMKSILTDIHIAQATMGSTITADSTRYSMKQYLGYILKSHSTDKQKFMLSLQFYTGHPEIMEEIYDSVITDLSKLEGESEGKQK